MTSATTSLTVNSPFTGVVRAARASNAAVLATTSEEGFSEFTHASQMSSNTVYNTDEVANVIPRMSSAAVVVVYSNIKPENKNIRAWEFTFDGHKFYVLHIGMQGTFVYDLTSGTWARWETKGCGLNWNMNEGVEWEDTIVAGDGINGIVWKLNPDSGVDDGFRAICRSCLLYTSPSPRDQRGSRMPSSA